MFNDKAAMGEVFSERLKQLLDAEGLSKSALARSVGASPTAISLYVRGRLPEPNILLGIARTFNVSMEWLLTGEGPMTRAEAKTEIGAAANLESYGLPEEARLLLDVYFELPTDLRKKFIGGMRMMLDLDQEVKKEKVEKLLEAIEKKG